MEQHCLNTLCEGPLYEISEIPMTAEQIAKTANTYSFSDDLEWLFIDCRECRRNNVFKRVQNESADFYELSHLK